MVLRNWLEGWFSRRSSRYARKNRPLGFCARTNLESLEVRTLLTTPAFGYALALGSTGVDTGYATAADHAGNVYVTGRFTGTVDFDPGAGTTSLTSVYGQDNFIAKYDPAGGLLWAGQISGGADTTNFNLTLSNFDELYVSGSFVGTTDFDFSASSSTLTSNTLQAGFVAKYTSSGTLSWARMLGDGTANVSPYALRTDSDGNVYSGGEIDTGTADMDPGAGTAIITNSSVDSQVYLTKLDLDGNFVWAKNLENLPVSQFGFSTYSYVDAIKVDKSQNVYFTGSFAGTIDFDPGVGTKIVDSHTVNQTDGYLVKLNSDGTFAYAVSMGTSNSQADDRASELEIDSSGNAYIGGLFTGTLEILSTSTTASLVSNGGLDAFVLKLDSTGDFTWAQSYGSTSNDSASALFYDRAGTLYVAGRFLGTVDFDATASTSNLTCGGNSDAFVLTLSTDGEFKDVLQLGGTTLSDIVNINSVSVNGFGDIFLTGRLRGSADLDPGQGTVTRTSAGSDDALLLKLTQSVPKPIVANDAYHTDIDVPLSVPAPGILANDVSGTANPLSARLISTSGGAPGDSLTFNPNGQIDYTPAPGFTGVVTIVYQATDGAFDSDPAYVKIYVGVNGSPNLNPAGDPVLTAIDEDVPQGSNPGTLISDIIASMAPKGGITDPDPGALQGLAIIGANQSGGTWQYSTNNGADWSDFGTTSVGSALLLASNANTRVRFLPKKDFNGTAAFCSIAWDQTDGNGNGSKVAIAAAGGTTAFSTTRDYPTITINAVNDAPVLTKVGMPQLNDINEDQTDDTNPGTLVSTILAKAALAGGKVKDVDSGALAGIAVIGANQTSGNWQFTTDGGLNWQNFTSTSVGNALALVSDANTRVRFQPKKDFQGDAQFTYIAWDQSDASANGSFHSITGGGSNAYSTGRQNAQLVIHPVNDAPILNNKGNPFIDPFLHTASSSQIHGNDIPTLVSRIPSTGGSITDVDGQTNSGIAVIGIGGTWEYSSDDGDTWTKIEPVSVHHALLLGWDVSTRIRLKQPGAAGVYGFTFVAWDMSSTESSLTYVDITAAGGTTPFSVARETATVTVT